MKKKMKMEMLIEFRFIESENQYDIVI